MGASCRRWTLDTERAFLFALRLEGQVARAAAAIGRDPATCYARKHRAPAFAADWDRTVAEMERERLRDIAPLRGDTGDALTSAPTRTRRDGWTQRRQRAFLRALADTGRYDLAAARVGLSYEAVRAFRARSPQFQALCEKALVEGGPSAAEAAWARAVEGWEEPIFHAGKLVGHQRRYSDALLRIVLAREETMAAGEQERVATEQETYAAVVRGLAALEKRAAAQKGE